MADAKEPMPRFALPFGNIAALDVREYKKKMEKIISMAMIQHHPDFEDAKYVEPSDSEIDEMNAEFTGAAQYEELLTDANLASLLGRRAYTKEMGLLHRSMSRSAIVATVMAAEDYANFKCLLDKKFSRTRIKNMSIRDKWKELLPNIEVDHPFFDSLVDIRNKKLTHFKEHGKLPLEYITDINFNNAAKGVQTVVDMINDYEKGKGEPPFSVDPPSKIVLHQLVVVIEGIMKGVRSETKDLIRKRAYELWQVDGCPPGDGFDYWIAAEVELGLQEP